VAKDCFCIRCNDTLDHRKDIFCMDQTNSGDTIESLAHRCNAFPDDIWMINIAGHKDCKERSQQGLMQNTAEPGQDDLPDPRNFINKIGFKVAAGAPGAPADHTGPGTSCKCSICLLDTDIDVRLFRTVEGLEGLIPTALWPISVRQIVIDCLHCIMRITESLLWALICCADENGNIDKLNKKLAEKGISVKIGRKKGSTAIEKPKLDGPSARKIISVGGELVKSIEWCNKLKQIDESFDAKTWETLNLRLWREWAWLAEAMSVVDYKELREEQIRDFGMHCRRFALYWRDAYPTQYMKSFYLHTLFHHGADSWEYIVKEKKLTLGMLCTTAMELRHLVYGRPAHKRSMRGGGGGRRRKCKETGKISPAVSLLKKIGKNAVSYLVLRELLLRDWGECNKLCTKCDNFRRECRCKKPQFLTFLGARKGSKRRKLEKDRHEHGTRSVTLPCQYGCSFVASSYAMLLQHESKCACEVLTNTDLREKVANQIRNARANTLLEEALGEEGSDHDDLQD